ncbi:His Kinase A (phospho-acceptor) domain-containing protein [Kandleria vitulina]|jgi:signal transduction histidine kinase|uniref:sensor histidine kinase n=1 Tax=Kandleria vitulina TaxID=1630 RepID=UPI00048C88F3|nr:HAMP domain-containing sensor histidine kinase [Kandleria vitulina]MEE0989447.1 HAMP domain-containing sensor histidine kinase [Kandleria vitulina]SDL74168.1 His Kinase A (phospho-acceptor) domain-containing protein [Kandleria vitulina]SEI89775.1 His Kinase A (phospho-acceptor) domain-containing protein [Kandleria vitulina]
MINRLRRKFILSAISALLLIVILFVGILDGLNYLQMDRKQVRTLNILEKYYKDEMSAVDNSEIPYASRYFVVVYDNEGQLVEINTARVRTIVNNKAEQYGLKAYHSKKKRDFISHYRYTKSKRGDSTYIIFLDVENSLEDFFDIVNLSIIFVVLGVVLFIFLIVILSGKVIKPFVDNYENQRNFIADAGHDLKTPITVIEADAEVLKMKFGDDNEFLNDIFLQSSRLKQLTEDLIYLSKLDENPDYEMIEFPLSDVITEICQSFESVAKTQKKEMTITIEPHLSFKGNQKNMERLVNILLDNAVKYSSDHGKIDVSLERQKKFIVLTVYNTVDHISKEELPKLFDRFYRSDQSRNSETGGYGIGLSVAKSVVEAHKGKINATTSDEKSLVMIVILPNRI